MLSFLQEIQDDVIEHAPVHQSVNTKAGNLLDACEANKVTVDVPHIKDEKQDINDRWERLGLTVIDVAKSTETLRKAVNDYETKLAPVEEAIVEMQSIVDEESPMSWDLLEMETYVRDLNVSVR